MPARLLFLLTVPVSVHRSRACRHPLFSARRLPHQPVPQPHARSLAGRHYHRHPGLQALLAQTPAPVLIDVYRRQWLQGRFHQTSLANLPGSHWLAQYPAMATSRRNGKATSPPVHLQRRRPDTTAGLLLPLRLLVELERGKTCRQPGLYLCVLVSRWPGCLGSGEAAGVGAQPGKAI